MTTSTPTGTTPGGNPPPSAPKRPGIPGPSLITSVGPRLLLLLVLLASAWLGFAQFASPVAVVPASAPASEFSAERAMSELQAIARVPHPMGSQAEADVRAYLVQQIRTLGFTPQVQTTTITQHWPGYNVYWAGTVNNVVVRLKGTANTKAILLDAHYDSVPTGPGATDCGSCVVTLLETMRALAAGPPLKNDVIFVFADGEERHDLGAHAFATEHPWMKDVGLALNFEGMGTGGPAELYDSSPQNGWLTTEFLARAILADPLIMACLLVFLAGFRRLIRRARPDGEWISTLVFGAGLVVIALELAGDALAGGAALDTSVQADPSVVRGLWEGSFVFYGAIGLIMSALLLASAGCATLATGVLPRWAGWAAYIAAVVNLMAVPSILGGTDSSGFYTANGYVTFIGQGVMIVWFLIASILMLVVKWEAKAITPAYQGI